MTPLLERLDGWPDLVALHAFDPERYPFLLESAAHGPAQARWDILFACPGHRLQVDGAGEPFLPALDEWWRRERVPALSDSRVPFAGGWFVFCAYELAGEVEPTLALPSRSDDPLPVAAAVRIPVAVLRDHVRHEAWLVAEPQARRQRDLVLGDLATLREAPAAERGSLTDGALIEDDAGRYLDAVARARQYVYDGDVFQANLSRAWRGTLRDRATALDCYRRLRAHNPAPFAGLMRWSDHVTVASSSPERLVRVTGERVETRPIAGTRRRGADADADAALLAELVAHPKERAEHVMLIDLERNDLGRISRYGTVAVDEMMGVESYPTVHHIVSNLHGVLRDDVTPGGVIGATFPGGTITGCPKVRCMEIIAELEGEARGAYTGSFGWLAHNGDMDLNILIRTLTVRGREIELRAGAGIVADSEPERELDETRAKAAGLLRALAADA
ncbi:MAG: aminodeoxychorismate synthase component I [Gammaproteobacteria bacterium]